MKIRIEIEVRKPDGYGNASPAWLTFDSASGTMTADGSQLSITDKQQFLKAVELFCSSVLSENDV